MVKDHVTEVLVLLNSGFHCSQAIFAAFTEDLGLSQKTAHKIACPFGGGIGGLGGCLKRRKEVKCQECYVHHKGHKVLNFNAFTLFYLCFL